MGRVGATDSGPVDCPECTIEPLIHSAYEACSRCGGYGIVDGLYGPRDCPDCGGDCYVRARDERGRFTSRAE